MYDLRSGSAPSVTVLAHASAAVAAITFTVPNKKLSAKVGVAHVVRLADVFTAGVEPQDARGAGRRGADRSQCCIVPVHC